MKLGIGIDTGGTYTGAVLYDFERKTILAGAKAITTKNDLAIGILGAIDALPADRSGGGNDLPVDHLGVKRLRLGQRRIGKIDFFGGDKK